MIKKFSNYKNIIKHAQNDIELKKVSLILEYPKSKIHDIKVDLFCLQELYTIYNEKDNNRKGNKSR